MLSIGKLGIGQERYYLDKVAEGAEDYYSGEAEAEGYWLGDAARDLGLTGKVEAEQLTAMLAGRSPLDGEALVGMQGVGAKGSVPGFDLTFSMPKSASLLWALGGPEVASEVLAAHHAAAQAALDYMQRQACWTRRGKGGAQFVHGNGFLAAGYLHRSSRAGDPQVHLHLLIANATKGPDGRWTRLYHPAIYTHAKTASYIYEAQFRHELTGRLGVRWQEVRKGIAEIEGFEDAHLGEFSTRRKQILEAVGPNASARSRQIANLSTREAKEAGVSQETLRERWRSQAEEVGLSAEVLAATRGREPAPGTPVLNAEQIGREVTASASHFDRRDAIQAVANSLPFGAPAERVEAMADAFLASPEVIRISEGPKGERFTTRRIWELERGALAAAERMRAAGPTPAGELIAARVIAARPTLKADQRATVERLLCGGEGLSVVIGEAGSGKTFAIVAAAEGWAQAGTRLRAAAPTWRAANVMRAEGLPATSIAALLGELERGEGLDRESVLLVDEAGMVDSANLARLIDHAETANAKLVLVGDPEQLGEIEAGGLFRALAERSETVHLDQVIRHRHDLDREAAKRIREGKGVEALSLYRSEERVIVAPNAETRREAMVADWHQAFDRGEDAVMVAKRNADVAKLNDLARAVMRQDGRLGKVEVWVGDGAFAAGDQVITRVNDRRAQVFNRERWRIAEVDAERGAVVLEGIDQARRVALDADYLAATNPYGDAPALQHAYAVTTYSAQGTTVDRAFVMADPSMDKQELYVAASRSREQTYLYATPEIQTEREEFAPRPAGLPEAIPQIAEAAGRDGAQLAAHDVALRSELSGLPTDALVDRRRDLEGPVRAERLAMERRAEAQERVTLLERSYESAVARAQAAEELPRRERKRELPRALDREASAATALSQTRSALERLEVPTDVALREVGVIDRVLAERREAMLAAMRIAPPAYVVKELGERPTDPKKAKVWDRGVVGIEGYRERYGVSDPARALGRESGRGGERAARQQAERRLREAQRQLGGEEGLGLRVRELGRGMGIGR